MPRGSGYLLTSKLGPKIQNTHGLCALNSTVTRSLDPLHCTREGASGSSFGLVTIFLTNPEHVDPVGVLRPSLVWPYPHLHLASCSCEGSAVTADLILLAELSFQKIRGPHVDPQRPGLKDTSTKRTPRIYGNSHMRKAGGQILQHLNLNGSSTC